MQKQWKKICLGLLALPALALSAPFQYFDPTVSANVPKLLSLTGVYTNTVTKTLDTAAKYFEVNAALWSDDAVKTRWVILRPGKKIPYNDTTDFFDYPDSTVFVKTFKLEKIQGDTSSTSRIYWETRLMVKKADPENHEDWRGFSYRWRADQSDADLVSMTKGFDTVFTYTDLQKKQTYRKWHFPSQADCARCHRAGYGFDYPKTDTIFARSILGFYPAQLKRPSPLVVNTNQIIDFFNKGIFSGTQPTATQLAARFKSIHEALPTTLTAAQRFAAIDTMARSYIAGNCSGCHGTRGLAVGAVGEAGADLNFDFFRIKPKLEMGKHHTGAYQLNEVAPYDTANISSAPKGRAYWLRALGQWGIDTATGKVWDMHLPAGDPATLVPAMIYPGYPALSEILYRQWARNSPWVDSASVSRNLRYNVAFGDSIPAAIAKERLTWIFSKPWGSQAWLAALASHNLSLDSIVKPNPRNVLGAASLFGSDASQMPPLATYIPDTAAQKILGEWVKNYVTLVVVDPNNIIAVRKHSFVFTSPSINNRILFVPDSWTGEAVMMDMQGRIRNLNRVGKGVYKVPSDVPVGVYFFKVGQFAFKSSIL